MTTYTITARNDFDHIEVTLTQVPTVTSMLDVLANGFNAYTVIDETTGEVVIDVYVSTEWFDPTVMSAAECISEIKAIESRLKD